MAKRKGSADSIGAWISDVNDIASRLDRLQSEVAAYADLAAMDARSTRQELGDIANAVGKFQSRFEALKREANGAPRKKWRPSQKAASEEEAQQFSGRL
ncbi:hypothetical protein KEC55_10795 [Burkholderia cepacia]|uniref:hypothetical protein n=1 Tax=Burkholderia cepacia TaxID=292 RepID=UPI00249E3FAD|nr:hypothetical protein [Burkholderia cepacia]WGY67342.1 hypothetical protein KEC55_10795 [Burkholderia cepacia]